MYTPDPEEQALNEAVKALSEIVVKTTDDIKRCIAISQFIYGRSFRQFNDDLHSALKDDDIEYAEDARKHVVMKNSNW